MTNPRHIAGNADEEVLALTHNAKVYGGVTTGIPTFMLPENSPGILS